MESRIQNELMLHWTLQLVTVSHRMVKSRRESNISHFGKSNERNQQTWCRRKELPILIYYFGKSAYYLVKLMIEMFCTMPNLDLNI